MIDWRRATSSDALRSIGESMNQSLHHRGPDAGDVWVDSEAGAVLAMRRLAVIDLSSAGAQPMISADGRYVIVHNGEIFNYRDMRRQLAVAGRAVRGNSDTEVLLEACAYWGVEAAIERAIGMFAFALWDRETRKLTLARDRLGIKPLYYSSTPGQVLFASQLKAFRKAPNWRPTIDQDAVVGYLRYAYIAQPRTIYCEAAKLPPGHILTLRDRQAPLLKCFWDLRAICTAGQAGNNSISDAGEAIEQLGELLRDSVERSMIGDVPLGAFLSGGIDSSTVVALMQAHSRRPIKTFSIGFHDEGFDESRFARNVAGHLGTDHTEFYVESRHALDVIPRLPEWFDEPFGDSSQIPTYLVSELARKQVTVALTGDGGDELFAGYSRYILGRRLARLGQLMPRMLGRPAAAALRALSPAAWNRVFGFLPTTAWAAQPGDRLHKVATILDDPGPNAMYRRLVSHWERPNDLVAAGEEPYGPLLDRSIERDFPDPVARMQFLDLVTYLPDDLLTKVDRASMAVGLEGRVPLLDHRVVAFACSLPHKLKVRRGRGKWLLRQVLHQYLPEPLVERPKMGFGVPLAAWLCGPLRDWVEDLLEPTRLEADGMLQAKPIRGVWRQHLEGSRNWQYPLWTILMFQAWRARWT